MRVAKVGATQYTNTSVALAHANIAAALPPLNVVLGPQPKRATRAPHAVVKPRATCDKHESRLRVFCPYQMSDLMCARTLDAMRDVVVRRTRGVRLRRLTRHPTPPAFPVHRFKLNL